MYDHISSQGVCVEPYLPVPFQVCNQDVDCDDKISCTDDNCNKETSQCSNVMKNNCCGNFVCEAGESSCSDCGPFMLQTPDVSPYYTPHGVFFDVEGINDIFITGIKFYLTDGPSQVNIYTTSGSVATDPSSNKPTNVQAWAIIFSGTYNFESETH